MITFYYIDYIFEKGTKRMDLRKYHNEFDEKFKALQYSYPKLSELKKENRLDTRLYEKSYKLNNSLIENYSNGYFQILVKKFKSGSTPKIRIFNDL